MTDSPGYGVILLAGGRGSRMGGVDKAQVTLDGVRLVDRLLARLHPRDDAPVVVVSPTLTLSGTGVTVVSEDPPYGGPVAGIATGVAAVAADGGVDLVGVLSVDAPDSAELLPVLADALADRPEADVAVIRAADGYLQPLCAMWRAGSLRRALASLDTVRDQAAKKLLAAAGTVVEVSGDGAERDYDTLAELAERGRAELP